MVLCIHNASQKIQVRYIHSRSLCTQMSKNHGNVKCICGRAWPYCHPAEVLGGNGALVLIAMCNLSPTSPISRGSGILELKLKLNLKWMLASAMWKLVDVPNPTFFEPSHVSNLLMFPKKSKCGTSILDLLALKRAIAMDTQAQAQSWVHVCFSNVRVDWCSESHLLWTFSCF